MKKYLVVKIVQHFIKKNKWIYIKVLNETKEIMIFDNKMDAEKYYNSIELKDNIKSLDRYSDFKGLFEYNREEITDDMIKNDKYKLDELKIIKDNSAFIA